MDKVNAELNMGIEFINVLISYRIVESNESRYVEFLSVEPECSYFVLNLAHRGEVEDSARKWCSDSAIVLCEPIEKEPEEYGFF